MLGPVALMLSTRVSEGAGSAPSSNGPTSRVAFSASRAAEDRTGAEMEALVACTTALLTIYDMLKAVDKAMVIGEVRLLEKTGVRSDFKARE